jgi:hypothetical protein
LGECLHGDPFVRPPHVMPVGTVRRILCAVKYLLQVVGSFRAALEGFLSPVPHMSSAGLG